ncbi:MAG: AAA family ATPase, partial [Gammaproteobacteria bacterium]
MLDRRLAEHAPSRIQLLTGPRQVGKTTVLLALAKRHDEQAIYVAADGPEAAVPGFWERLWVQVEEASRSRKIVLLLDEVQH